MEPIQNFNPYLPANHQIIPAREGGKKSKHRERRQISFGKLAHVSLMTTKPLSLPHWKSYLIQVLKLSSKLLVHSIKDNSLIDKDNHGMKPVFANFSK